MNAYLICMKSLADKNSCRRKMKASSWFSPSHVYISTSTGDLQNTICEENKPGMYVSTVSLSQSDLHFQSVIKLVPQARGCHGNKTGIPAPAASRVPRATHEISICTSVFVSKEETHFSHNFSRLWNKALENDAKRCSNQVFTLGAVTINMMKHQQASEI